MFLIFFFCVHAASAAETDERTVAIPVAFSFSAPRALSAALAGSFNHWDPSRHHLQGPDRNGTWTITIQLPPGRYEYLFVIDNNRWELDPAAATTDDGMGGRNSVVVVGPK